MVDLLSLTLLAVATIFALAAASGLHWITLQLACRLMQPATARRTVRHEGLAQGTVRVAQAFSRR